MDTQDINLRVGYSRLQLILLGFASAGFVALGIFVFMYSDKVFPRILGFFAVPFFSACGVFITSRLFVVGDILIIDAVEIYDKRVTDRPIPWSAVTALDEIGIKRQILFALTLSQPVARFVSSPWKLLMIRMNKFFGFHADIYITATGLDVSIFHLRNALEAGLKQSLHARHG